MLTAHGGTRIEASVEDVFDFVADARNEPRWLLGAADVRMTSEGPVGLGSTFVGSYARAGEVGLAITRYERPHRLTITGTGRGMTFTDDIELGNAARGTQLTATMTTQPRGLFRVMAPMIGRVIKKQFAANWEHLRTVITDR